MNTKRQLIIEEDGYELEVVRAETVNQVPKNEKELKSDYHFMGLLKKNTNERDYLLNQVSNLNKKINEMHLKHIETLGRFGIIGGTELKKEALDYADKNNIWIKCESKYVNVFSNIDDYEIKKGKNKGKKIKAHYTENGKYIKSCESENDKPISYQGYFKYSDYKNELQKYLKTSIFKFEKIEDLFDFNL